MLQTYGMGGGGWIVVVPVCSPVEHSCYIETVWLVLQTYGGRGGGSRLVDSLPNGKTFMLNFTNTYVAV